jgi:hypothetical protein
MKRIVVLIAVLALLVSGAVSVLADPIHVGGGQFTSSTLSPIHVGGGQSVTAHAKIPVQAKAYGLHQQGMEEPEMVLLSPIHVGGGQ